MHQTVPFILDIRSIQSLSTTSSIPVRTPPTYIPSDIIMDNISSWFYLRLSLVTWYLKTPTHARPFLTLRTAYRWHIKKVTSLKILFTGLLNRIHCGVIFCGNNFTVFIFRDADSLGLFFIMWISVENKFAYLPFKQWISWCLQVK